MGQKHEKGEACKFSYPCTNIAYISRQQPVISYIHVYVPGKSNNVGIWVIWDQPYENLGWIQCFFFVAMNRV